VCVCVCVFELSFVKVCIIVLIMHLYYRLFKSYSKYIFLLFKCLSLFSCGVLKVHFVIVYFLVKLKSSLNCFNNLLSCKYI